MKFVKYIDDRLNNVTMYRLVFFVLVFISFSALIFSFLGQIHYSPTEITVSLALATLTSFFSNLILAKLFRTSVNAESALITGLLLFLIVSPGIDSASIISILVANVVAQASKYLIAPIKRHIFNPAAFGAFVIFILGIGGATWWVANPVLLGLVLLGGILLTRKIRRFSLVLQFSFFALLSILYFNLDSGVRLGNLFLEVFLSWPLVFFATFMLTEPITTPPRAHLRTVYALLVGTVFGSQFHIGPIIPTPEFALLVGNVFSYLVGFKSKIIMTLKEKKQIGENIYEFIFSRDRHFSFLPGQYMEWTLPRGKADARGNRRYFSISSSPSEADIRLGVKFYEPSSSFKKLLLALKNGETLSAGGLAGDFVLPKDENQKLVFIAGGIGITPFRSMIQYLIDKDEKRDILLFYATKSEKELAYKEVFIAGERVGLRTKYVVSRIIDTDFLRVNVPDWSERKFYISGPDPMVRAMEAILVKMGIPQRHLATDYFLGYA